MQASKAVETASEKAITTLWSSIARVATARKLEYGTLGPPALFWGVVSGVGVGGCVFLKCGTHRPNEPGRANTGRSQTADRRPGECKECSAHLIQSGIREKCCAPGARTFLRSCSMCFNFFIVALFRVKARVTDLNGAFGNIRNKQTVHWFITE